MDINRFIELYWNYYLQLENEVFATEPFCAIDKINDTAYSTKYLQLILSVCGEIDTICKQLCKSFSPDFNIDQVGINDYRDILMQHRPQIADEVLTIEQHAYRDIQPWQAWKHHHNPHWWDVYNKVKHHRDEMWNGKAAFKHANQKAAIESLCALYILIEYLGVQYFVMNTRKKNVLEMLSVKSERITMGHWYRFYTSFMGVHFFETAPCKAYFNCRSAEDGTT